MEDQNDSCIQELTVDFMSIIRSRLMQKKIEPPQVLCVFLSCLVTSIHNLSVDGKEGDAFDLVIAKLLQHRDELIPDDAL